MQMVQQYMQRNPQTIPPSTTLSVAHKVMRQACIRHLPVVAEGVLVGIVSLHDLHLLETLEGVNLEEATVEEAMTTQLYAAAPHTSVTEVALGMADRGIGSALVVDDAGRLLGILTTANALRVLARKPAVAVIEDPTVDGSTWIKNEITQWPRPERERRA